MSSFDTWPPISIAGTGSYLPARVVTNDELVASGLDTTAAWIVARTGIVERRWAADDETTASLAANACRAALDDAGVHPDEIDLVVLATSSPDWQQPATASAVHAALGLRGDAGAMDVNVVCSGFVYALQAAAGMLAGAEAWTTVLVVGAELYSRRVIDPGDRSTRIFFGDGAGAVVLRKELEIADIAAAAAASSGIDLAPSTFADIDGGADEDDTPGLRSFVVTVQHEGSEGLVAEHGGFLHMDGPGVRAFAIPAFVGSTREACAAAGIDVGDLALLVPHNSNLRTIETASAELGIPLDRVAITVDRTGNTASASVPIALDAAARAGRLHDGDLVCLSGYGGGLQSAASVLRWSIPE